MDSYLRNKVESKLGAFVGLGPGSYLNNSFLFEVLNLLGDYIDVKYIIDEYLGMDFFGR